MLNKIVFSSQYNRKGLKNINKNGYFKCLSCGHFQHTTEFGEFRQDDYCTKQEYLDHFIDYDSDKEYIVARATLTKEQAKRLYNKLIYGGNYAP